MIIGRLSPVLILLKKTLVNAMIKAVMAARKVFKRVLLLFPSVSVKKPGFVLLFFIVTNVFRMKSFKKTKKKPPGYPGDSAWKGQITEQRWRHLRRLRT